MHTVRTQLDHFQLVIPQLTDAFTVYAVDFPGMGWSDIVPGASYEEPALRAAIVRVIEELDLSDVTLAGESIGASDHDWSRDSDRRANITSVTARERDRPTRHRSLRRT